MKKIVLFFLGVLLLLGCQKAPDRMLLGVWKFEKSTVQYHDTGEIGPVKSDCKTVTFKEGGIGYYNDTPFTYTVNGNELRMMMPNVTNDYTIEELTADRLRYSMVFSEIRPNKITTYFTRFE